MADINKSVEVKFESNADQVKSEVDGLLSSLDKTSNEYEDLERSLRDVVNAEQKLIQSEQKLTEQLGRTKGATASIEEEVRKNTIAYQNKVRELDNVRQRYSQVDESGQRLNTSTRALTSSVSSNGGAMGLLSELTGGLAMTFKDAGEATELFGGKLTGIRGALVATGIGALVIAVGLLIENWDELSAAISGTTAAEEALIESSGELNSKLSDAYEKIFKVKTSFDLAKSGVISKKDALDDYNSTLGDTLGEAKSLEEAESLYVRSTGAYIKSTIARATAQIFLKQAAEENAKLELGNAAELSGTWQKTVGVIIGEANALDIFSKGNVEDTKKNITNLKALAEEQIKIAETLDKEYNMNTGGKKDGKKDGKKVEVNRELENAKELAKNLKEENLKNSQTEYEQLEEKYKRDKALLEKYKIDTTELEKKYMNDVNNLRLKDSEVEKKRNEDKLKSLTDLLDKSKVKEKEYSDAKNFNEVNEIYNRENLKLVAQKESDILKAQSLGATEEDIKNIKAYYDQLDIDNKKRKSDAELKIKTSQAEEEAKIEVLKNKVIASSKENLNNIISGLEATGLAKTKAGQAIAKTLALTQIGIDSATALSKASTLANAEGVAAQLAFPLVPGAGTAARILSYVSTGAQVASNIVRAKQLLSSGGSGGSGGGGASVGANIPASAAPNVSFVSSNENQVASSIQRTTGEQPPLRAYVVSGDVTTAQSLDRNIINNSSIG